MLSNKSFWKIFRKVPIHKRKKMLFSRKYLYKEEALYLYPNKKTAELADVFVEAATGVFCLPLGISTGFLIDGSTFHIPMATEEASVIISSSYAAHIIAHNGGFNTIAAKPITQGQIIMEKVNKHYHTLPQQDINLLTDIIRKNSSKMEKRGGGLQKILWRHIKEDLYSLDVFFDVQDVMGANFMNSILEILRSVLEAKSKGKCLLAVVSNEGIHRHYRSSFSIPLHKLSLVGTSGYETARRIIRASHIAHIDSARAVTHNKGIMNGITAFAIATGNDSRAIEATVHAYASQSGKYQGLGTYSIEDNFLNASIDIPLFFASKGGSTDHPTARWSRKILSLYTNISITASILGTIAACVGLAQNFAALLALTGEGIQKGHLPLHKKKILLSEEERQE